MRLGIIAAEGNAAPPKAAVASANRRCSAQNHAKVVAPFGIASAMHCPAEMSPVFPQKPFAAREDSSKAVVKCGDRRLDSNRLPDHLSRIGSAYWTGQHTQEMKCVGIVGRLRHACR